MDAKDLQAKLENIAKVKNFSFAKNTTYACGGRAEVAYFPSSLEQAIDVYDYLTQTRQNFITLGNGSNVLASDKNFSGAVISTRRLKGITQTAPDCIFCYAGTTVSELMRFCLEKGLGGLEYLAGIPASIGGLALMNGGAGGIYISKNIIDVMLYNGEISYFSNKKCNFGYKYSIMRDIKCLILGVKLKVCALGKEKVRDNISLYLGKRKFHPKGASCGCVFKNPEGTSAGKLIEECGLKGMACGGAYVSYEHANFLINRGGCAADVYCLISSVKEKVFEKTGVELKEEVVYIGDF